VTATRCPAMVGVTSTWYESQAEAPAARVPGFQVTAPEPPTAGSAVTLPWVTASLPAYTAAPPGM